MVTIAVVSLLVLQILSRRAEIEPVRRSFCRHGRLHVYGSGTFGAFRYMPMGIHYRGVQWKGGAEDGGSII